MDTPALDHWEAVSAKFELLVQFMAWLDANRGYYIASDTAREMADGFLLIDRKQLSRERIALLNQQLQETIQAEQRALAEFLAAGAEADTLDMAGLQTCRMRLLQQVQALDELVQQLTPVPTPCATCQNWGRTVTRDEYPEARECLDCGRVAWPSRDVNIPAGAATAIAIATAVEILRTVTNTKPDGTEHGVQATS